MRQREQSVTSTDRVIRDNDERPSITPERLTIHHLVDDSSSIMNEDTPHIRRTLIRITNALIESICTSPTFGRGEDGRKDRRGGASKLLTPDAKDGVGEMLGKCTPVDVSTRANEIRSVQSSHWASPLHSDNIRPSFKVFDLRSGCLKQGCCFSPVLRGANARERKTSPAIGRPEARPALHPFEERGNP